MSKILTVQIAVAYYGSKIRTSNDTIGNLVGVFSKHICCNIELPDGTISVGHKLSDCQLILTPLSEISAKQANEIIAIAANEDYAPLEVQDIPEWLDEIMSSNACMTADYVSGRLLMRIITYCQRNGIDVGYDDMPSLILADIATRC